MTAQVGLKFIRPAWPHEFTKSDAVSARSTAGQGAGFERLAEFKSIRSSLDLQDLQIIAATRRHLEFHHSIPFISAGRPFVFMADSLARMFAPFLFDETAERRTELETAVPIYEALLAADNCIRILTPFSATRSALQRAFPSAEVGDKICIAPLIVSVKDPIESIRTEAPVFLIVSKPPVCDAFGQIADLSLCDSWCASTLAFAAFVAIQKHRPDARLIWLCPDWRQDPTRSSACDIAGLAPLREGFGAWLWTQELSALVETGNVTVVSTRTNDQELRRLLTRADFLLDFSSELDSFLALQALQNGCIPVLLDMPETREAIGAASSVLIEIENDCWRRNALGFVEGFNSLPQSIERMLAAVRNSAKPIMELIEDRAAAERLRSIMKLSFTRRYCRSDLDSCFTSNIRANFQAKGKIRRPSSRPLGQGDFSCWPAPIAEHRFDGMEIVAVGPSVHGRLLPTASETSDDAAPKDFVAARFDVLIQNFADFKIGAPTKLLGPRLPAPVRYVSYKSNLLMSKIWSVIRALPVPRWPR